MYIDKTIYLNAVNTILSNFAYEEARLLLYCLAHTLFGGWYFTYEDFEALYAGDNEMPQMAIDFLVETGYMRKVHLLWIDEWYYAFFPVPRFDLPPVIECADLCDDAVLLAPLHREYQKKIDITLYRVDWNDRK